MAGFLEIAVFLIFFLVFAYFRISPGIWTPLIGLLLILTSYFEPFGFLRLIEWLVFVLLLFFFTISQTRRYILTSKILIWFGKKLPNISQVEQEALQAGRVSWEKELFSGNPNWNKLKTIPPLTLSVEEEAFLNDQVENLCAMLNEWNIVQDDHNLPQSVWDYLKKEGFFGLQIPKQYGGHGFSVWAHSSIVKKISTRSISAGITVMVPNTVGSGEFLQRFGTVAQKEYYLPRLVSGEEIPAFALTELEAGSDAAAIRDAGIVCRGKYGDEEVIGIRLNWDKRYITLAPVATLLSLAFQMYDPEHLLGPQEEIGLTLCLVPTHLSGVEIGKRHYPSGLGFLNGPTRGCDVFVPLDFIVGGPDMRGKGWHMLMNGLAQGRGISLPALSAAIAKLCYGMTGAYAQIRRQFNRPIGQFEGVAQMLGQLGGLTYMCEAIRYFTLSLFNQGTESVVAAAISKYQTSEIARVITNIAMDIHAGYAIQLGPNNYLGLVYQALPIGITVEGANLLTRNLIIFSQGAMSCHPYLQAEIKATCITDPMKRLATFDAVFSKHLGYILANFTRVLIQGVTKGRFIRTAHDPVFNQYCRHLTQMSTVLAFITDIIFAVLGKQFKQKEMISARLGDVLSELYLASATIKYYQDKKSPASDLIFVRWILERCLQRIQDSLHQVLYNLKPRWFRYLLQKLIFPWGKFYHGPTDTLTQQIAAQMMQPSEQRNQILQHCYVGKGTHDPTGRIESAFQMLGKIKILYERWEKIMYISKYSPKDNIEQLEYAKKTGKFSENELELLKIFLDLRTKALQVDEFDR